MGGAVVRGRRAAGAVGARETPRRPRRWRRARCRTRAPPGTSSAWGYLSARRAWLHELRTEWMARRRTARDREPAALAHRDALEASRRLESRASKWTYVSAAAVIEPGERRKVPDRGELSSTRRARAVAPPRTTLWRSGRVGEPCTSSNADRCRVLSGAVLASEVLHRRAARRRRSIAPGSGGSAVLRTLAYTVASCRTSRDAMITGRTRGAPMVSKSHSTSRTVRNC